MNNTSRALLPAVTAGLVFLFSGSAAYLYSTIQPIPPVQEDAFAAYRAEGAAKAPAIPEQAIAEPEISLPENLPETAYLVKLEGDMLYVYAEGSREPDAVYTLPAEWLPDYDRTLLEYGFRVSDSTELREIIEDYIS